MKLEDVLACVDEELELPVRSEEEQADCYAVLLELRSGDDTCAVECLRAIVRLCKAGIRERIMERWVE